MLALFINNTFNNYIYIKEVKAFWVGNSFHKKCRLLKPPVLDTKKPQLEWMVRVLQVIPETVEIIDVAPSDISEVESKSL